MGRPKGSTKSKKRELDAHFDFLLFLNVFKRRTYTKANDPVKNCFVLLDREVVKLI
ncbi:hypothetical protein [Mycoplasmopsis bovis]|uniref:hypothetical protein n=1 Tax=Mycoplasmopsis bovis TaxID=28903 RepID=UPI003D2D8C4B